MIGFTDIHCHILPGVDDGAADMSRALALVRMAYQDGTRTMILTPHYRGRFKQNTPQQLHAKLAYLQEMVDYPDLQLFLGNEAHYETDLPDKLLEGRVLRLADSDYCLLEFSTASIRSQVITGVSEMLRCGVTPIVAHAERYRVFREDRHLLDEVLHMGALIQLNADSILGVHGFSVKHFCAKALKAHKVHFVATDAHDTKARTPILSDCFLRVSKKYGENYATALFRDNGLAVIHNQLL